MDKRPLFVRLPPDAAEKLDRAAFELRKTKQDLVAGLVQSHLPFPAGHYSFIPSEASTEVLTLAEAAELLRVDEDTVSGMAERGELPGRKLADEWRFARSAILRWLTGTDEES
jgi:excisionase family DNA binding protein